MFNDAQLDMLARVYARILAWPDEEEEIADCSAGSGNNRQPCGDTESAVPILPQTITTSGEEPISETEPNDNQPTDHSINQTDEEQENLK